MNANEIGAVEFHGVSRVQNIRVAGITPSWLRHGKGWATLAMRANRPHDNTWLQLITTETGEKSGKAAFFTLDRAGIAALRNMCNFALGADASSIVALLRDILSNAGNGAPDWSGLEDRVNALIAELSK